MTPSEDALELDVSANVMYDTNVSRSSRAVAAARGLKLDDVSYSPQASLNLNKSLGPDSLYLVGTIGYNFYEQNTVLNRHFFSSDAGVNLMFANCQATVGGGFKQQQSNLEYLAQNVSKDLATTASVRMSAECQRSVGFTPFFSVDRQWLTESAEAMKVQNQNQYRLSGGVAYSQPAIGQISVFGQYQTARFPKRQYLEGGTVITDGYDAMAGGIRFRRPIGTTLDVDLSFSYSSVDPTLAIEPGFNGTTYDAKVVWRPFRKMEIEARLSRDTRPSPQINSSYSQGTVASLQMTYSFSEKLRVDVVFHRSSDVYSGVALVQNVNLNRQTTKGVNGSVKYDISRTVSLSFTASTESHQTDISGFDFSGTHVGASLTAHL